MLHKNFGTSIVLISIFLQFVVAQTTFHCGRDHTGEKCIFKNVKILPIENHAYKFSGNVNCGYYHQEKYACLDKVVFQDSEIYTINGELLQFVGNKKLNISRAKLTSLDKKAFQRECKMKELIANDNEIVILSNDILSKCQNLKVIELRNNSMTTIENDAFFALALDKLDLSYNKIENVSAFSSIKSLKKLVLSFNLLKNIENNGFNNTLISLNLSNNHIETIDENAFIATSNLVELDLSSNRLKTIEKTAIRPLKNLRYLNTRNNNIRQIDLDFFENLPSLNSLIIAENSLDDLRAISKATSLILLDISFNPLEEIEVGTFSNLKLLQTLNLEATGLKTLEYGIFSQQRKLEILDLANNQFQSIDLNVFISCQSLTTLYLDGNGLFSLESQNTRRVLSKLNYIGLFDNNFGCRDLLTIVKNFKDENISVEAHNMRKVAFHEANVHGIRCLKGNVAQHGEQNTQFKIGLIIGIIFIIIITIFMLYLMYAVRMRDNSLSIIRRFIMNQDQAVPREGSVSVTRTNLMDD